jgi:DNA recombination-mediator protein A/DprA/Smf-like nucleotide binding protein involved in DNA uptake
MPRRPRSQSSTPSPDEADSLFADLLEDEIGVSEGEANDANEAGDDGGMGKSGIPPAIAYQSADAATAPETALDDPELPFWLALNRVCGIGPARFRLLLEGFGSARGAWEAGPADWQAAGLDSRSVSALEQQRGRIEPEAEVERFVRLHIGALRTIDPAYPRLLQEIPLPPPVLYVRGTLGAADEWALAIVGTRRASWRGRRSRLSVGWRAASTPSRIRRRWRRAAGPSRYSAADPTWSIPLKTRNWRRVSSSRARF